MVQVTSWSLAKRARIADSSPVGRSAHTSVARAHADTSHLF